MRHFGKMLAVAALAMISYSANAELAPQWSKGTMIGNINIGAVPFGSSVSLDYVLVDEWWKGHFSVGGEFDIADNDRDNHHYDNYKCTAIGVTPRATYGINITPEFEVHATMCVGFGVRTWSWRYENYKYEDNESFVLWNEFVGCRYFFNDCFGVMAETGYSNWFPEFRLGFNFKF